MKIKHAEVKIEKGYTWLTLWLMLPDFYTWWGGLGQTDREYLEGCWERKDYVGIKDFMRGYRLSLCRGSIKFGARQEAAKKKFSWTWFRVRIYGTWTELNTPIPKPPTKPELIKTREVPISRTSHFLTLLRIPTHIPIPSMKDYITLFILRRDHGKNISDERIYR